MLIYCGKELDHYKNADLRIQKTWNKRDFVTVVKNYLDSTTEKVLAILGLRGTGKTVGILQAAEPFDICYIIAQEEEKETGPDYINILKNINQKYIVIDEYSWIKDRDRLDRLLAKFQQLLYKNI
jgi:predicted AAA+ superfamily ATPase